MLPNYNPLTDKFLVKYFQNENIRNNLKAVGLVRIIIIYTNFLQINEKNEILETKQQIPRVNIKLNPIQQRQDISHIIQKRDLSMNRSNDPSRLLELNNKRQFQYKKLPPLQTPKVALKGTLPDLYLKTHFQEFAKKYLHKLDSKYNNQLMVCDKEKSQSVEQLQIDRLFLKYYKCRPKKYKLFQPLFITYNKLQAKINNKPFNEKAFIAQRQRGVEIANKNVKNFYNNNDGDYNYENEDYEQDEYDDDEFEKDENCQEDQNEEESKERDEEINEKAENVSYNSYEYQKDVSVKEEIGEQINKNKMKKQQQQQNEEYMSDEFEETELITEHEE